MLLTNTEKEKESESRVFGLQPTSATIQLLCSELTQKGPFREGEKRHGREMTEKYRQMGKKRTSEDEQRGQNRRNK